MPEEGAWEEEWEADLDEADEEEEASWEHRESRSDAHDARPGEWHGEPAHGQAWSYPADERAQWLEPLLRAELQSVFGTHPERFSPIAREAVVALAYSPRNARRVADASVDFPMSPPRNAAHSAVER